MANNDTIKTLLKDLTNSFSFANLERFIREKNRHCIKLPTPHPMDLKTAIGVCDPDFTIHSNWLLIANGLNESEKSPAATPFVILVVKVDGELSARSCRKRQFDFAIKWLGWCSTGNAMDVYAKRDEKIKGVIRQGFFIFHDDNGNFRFSLVVAPIGNNDKPNYRRQTFFVEKGAVNRTFSDRMALPWNSLEDIKEAFSVEALNKEFYEQLSNWYFWAQKHVIFPEAAGKDKAERNATSLIRLITRLMFVWFMKQKGLIPEELFDRENVNSWFDKRDKTGSTYYKAILQNLFFATLNTEMGKNRKFVEDLKEFQGKSDGHGIQYYYRYKRFFKDPEAFLKLMSSIPFLNGGLFSSLDEIEYDEKGKVVSEKRIDCFSTNKKNEDLLVVPDSLFWKGSGDKEVDLSKDYGDSKYDNVIVPGLIPLLKQFNFTVDESSKNDETVALDPELLGCVFENLLASYNPATSTSARKQTGSFYTPREIVNYMVEESMIQNLKTALKEDNPPAEEYLRNLVSNGKADSDWISAHKMKIVSAFRNCKILDPACGSGAFPMGILQTMLRVWEALDPVMNDTALYGRKLELIENCIYGVDIQPVAVQISKLRCFISLLAEDDVDDKTDNRGIEPLPNLEMHFVAANSLIDVNLPSDWTHDEKIVTLIEELAKVRHDLFKARKAAIKRKAQLNDIAIREKLKLRLIKIATHPDEMIIALNQKQIESLQTERTRYLGENWVEDSSIEQIELFGNSNPVQEELTRVDINKRKRDEIDRRLRDCETKIKTEQNKAKNSNFEIEADKLAQWDPFNQNVHSPFFDMEWMFNVKDGFNIVIGNPPYVRADEPSEWNQKQRKEIIASKYYQTLWEKWDLFVPFIERGYQLLNPGGICTLIVSDAFCHSKYAQKPQEWYLRNSRVLRLDFCPDIKIFDAAVHNVIPFIQKADGKVHLPERRLHIGNFGNVRNLPTAPQSELTYRAFFPEDENKPATVFACQTLELSEICYISKGMVIHADEKKAHGAFLTDDLISNTMDKLHPKAFVEGKNLKRWFFPTNSYLEWGTRRAPKLFSRPTFHELYDRPEKLMLPMVGEICAAYDDKQLMCNHGIFVCVPWLYLSGIRNRSLKKVTRYIDEKPPRSDLPRRDKLEKNSRQFEVKYLLAIMNSAVAHKFLRDHRRNNIQLYPDDWKILPIPVVTPEWRLVKRISYIF
jgi:adenine-specific DNA-methyltransferase